MQNNNPPTWKFFSHVTGGSLAILFARMSRDLHIHAKQLADTATEYVTLHLIFFYKLVPNRIHYCDDHNAHICEDRHPHIGNASAPSSRQISLIPMAK